MPNSSPPTSGPHWRHAADPGFYGTELPDEELVHNLEHGQIVVSYNPDAAPPHAESDRRHGLRAASSNHRCARKSVPHVHNFIMTAWGSVAVMQPVLHESG